jgi:hypothetical protein
MMVLPRIAVLILMLAKPAYVVPGSFANWLWPALGFVFMPITTLAYVWAMVMSNKHIAGFYLAIVVMGVLLDLGLLTGAGNQKYRSAPPAEF